MSSEDPDELTLEADAEPEAAANPRSSGGGESSGEETKGRGSGWRVAKTPFASPSQLLEATAAGDSPAFLAPRTPSKLLAFSLLRSSKCLEVNEQSTSASSSLHPVFFVGVDSEADEVFFAFDFDFDLPFHQAGIVRLIPNSRTREREREMEGWRDKGKEEGNYS